MVELREDCKKLLGHIKKCTIAMDFDGYSYGGVIVYFLKLPFKKMHRYHFAKIEMYTDKITKYIKENKIDIKLDKFEELESACIIYGTEQVSLLNYKDYENRTKYLENLKEIITGLLEIIDSNDEELGITE